MEPDILHLFTEIFEGSAKVEKLNYSHVVLISQHSTPYKNKRVHTYHFIEWGI